MKRRRKRRGLKGRREVQEEEPGKGPPQAKKSHRGHVLFCFLAQRAWQVLILDFYRGSAREHFINREQKKKTGRCVWGGGSHSHRSALFFIPPHHTPHHIPQPFRDSSSRIVVAVALLVLSCRRVRLTASSACACRRFVTRKSFTVSRLPLRVCGRPRSLCPTEHRHQECRARSSLLLPLHPQACKKGHRGSSGPLPSPTSFPLSKLYSS